MDQKWIHMLITLVFFQRTGLGLGEDVTPAEGNPVEIKCKPSVTTGTMVIWFRVLDTSELEFIGSFAPDSDMKKSTHLSNSFTYSKIRYNIVTLTSFKNEDSGIYTCAAFKSNALHFGQLTRLRGKTPVVTKAPPTTCAKEDDVETTTACACPNRTQATSISTLCNPIILGALAGSCGLLLLLLIVISVYCNRIRTRRCPHHHKRKPRTAAPPAKYMANRHI